MEIVKNNKTYFYWYPKNSNYNYEYLIDKLSDLDIDIARINYDFCRIRTDKRIITKLKKYFGKNNVILNDYDNLYNYTIYLK